jgi:hypothetical protein
MTHPIGRLRRVPLRDVWPHEAHDFTVWMEQNVDVLNEVLDITLVNIEREKKTQSAFSVDLVAEDEDGGVVIIENQLGKSDHDHLGKLITYLAALSAQSAIWIVSHPRPEHVAAVTWLNASNGARFYLLKVEAVQIGDSAAAPLLTVIAQPGELLEEVGDTKKELDERHHLRNAWWKTLLVRDDANLHAHITPGNHPWVGLSKRRLGFNYTVTMNDCGAELYIDRGKGAGSLNRLIFEELLSHKEAIEQAFGAPLSWEALESKRACRIRAALKGGYRNDEAEWEGIQSRQVSAMQRLHDILWPYVERLNFTALEAAANAAEAEGNDGTAVSEMDGAEAL